MKLSTRCRYGTRALIEIAKNYNLKPTKRKDIEKTQGISSPYLENILSILKNKHILKTTRGADGGFALEKQPSSISLYDVVVALEGSISPVECLEKPDQCKEVASCITREVWKRLNKAQKKALEEITLQDLVDWQKNCNNLDFSI